MTAPTPEQRAAWRGEAEDAIAVVDGGDGIMTTGEYEDQRRILALLDALDAAEVKVAQAWDEGYEGGRDDEAYEERGEGPYPAYPHKNPYPDA